MSEGDLGDKRCWSLGSGVTDSCKLMRVKVGSKGKVSPKPSVGLSLAWPGVLIVNQK